MKWVAGISALALSACAEVKMPTPISLPSICMGEETCEARKNAETLAEMGYPDAGLVIMCADERVRAVLEEECGNELFYLSVY